MTSHYHPLYYESDKQYPYASRVVAGEDHVDFIYQLVKNNNSAAMECSYKNTTSISDTSEAIIGTPTKFSNYNGDLSETFAMRTCGFDISTSPRQKHVSRMYSDEPQDDSNIQLINKCDYIDFEFHEAVFPIRVSMYEVYNPGYVTQIWAQDSDDRWFLLWAGRPQIVSSTSRIFSPPLQSCNFKTKILRLKFMYSLRNYTTRLDAVKLIGTSKLILPKNPKQSLTYILNCINCKYPCHRDIRHNLTLDYENTHLDIFELREKFTKYCIIYKSDITKTVHKSKKVSQKKNVPSSKQGYTNHYSLKNHSNYKKVYKERKFVKDIKLSSDKSKKQSHCSVTALPVKYSKKSIFHNEIILKILKGLDVRTLYHVSSINNRLNNVTRDPLLFPEFLNLGNMDTSFIYDIIFFFDGSKYTCENIRKLDLTSANISVSYFVKFLNICGSRLTHLRLSNCRFVDSFALYKISTICKHLKALDLSFCDHLRTVNGFLYLEKLEFLEYLNLDSTRITVRPLCKILRKNPRMRKLILSYAFLWFKPHRLEKLFIQMGNSCPDLEKLDVMGSAITSRGINALAKCKNLRKLNIGSFFDEHYGVDLDFSDPEDHYDYDHDYNYYKHNNPAYYITHELYGARRYFESCRSLKQVNCFRRSSWYDR